MKEQLFIVSTCIYDMSDIDNPLFIPRTLATTVVGIFDNVEMAEKALLEVYDLYKVPHEYANGDIPDIIEIDADGVFVDVEKEGYQRVCSAVEFNIFGAEMNTVIKM